jgi:hypothetical protein
MVDNDPDIARLWEADQPLITELFMVVTMLQPCWEDFMLSSSLTNTCEQGQAGECEAQV